MANMQTNANVVWNSGVKGNGVLKTEFLDAKVAIPTVLGGSGNGAFPKEVLVASVTACYTSVLVSMAESRGLPVVEITVDSEASISDDEFKIIHHPQLVLSENATDKQVQSAERLFVAADKGCVVGNLLKKADVKIEVQGEIFTT
ncbi:hypothetical protein DOZ91_01435 [Peribacillus frigoritolerans]|nr:hypothetical protein DOZ91_01435 [Peribacillus frigoritolerans]